MSAVDSSLGDEEAFDGPLYEELRTLAAARMRAERADHTLQPTAVVHEAWLRMKDFQPSSTWGRTRFYALAARTLRRVLVDHARGRDAQKRGGEHRRQELKESLVSSAGDQVRMLDLEQALTRLGRRSKRQAKVIEMRFFGGLSVQETAEALEVSEDTIKRDWRLARAWLNRELKQDPA